MELPPDSVVALLISVRPEVVLSVLFAFADTEAPFAAAPVDWEPAMLAPIEPAVLASEPLAPGAPMFGRMPPLASGTSDPVMRLEF